MRTLAAALAIIAALGTGAPIAQARERVTDFHSAVSIAADGTLTVQETIEVEVEGREIRRGILRDFPTEYHDRLGHRVIVPFDVLEVRRNGAPESYALSALDNGVRIRIGNADVMLPRGRHVYVIRYRTARQLGFFPDHDELYWNVNGTGWTFAFDSIRADVTLPAPVPAGKMRAEAYTGPQGARGRDYVFELREGGAAFATTRALGSFQGLTIVLEFPKGVVAPPSWWQRTRWFFAANRGVLAGVGGFLLLLVFYTWRWTLVGRDPRAGPKFPRYEAPPGFGAGAVRYLHEMGYDNTAFAATLLGLGQRGALKIEKSGDTYALTRTGSPAPLLPGESPVLRMVPRPGDRLEIGNTHNPAVQAASGEVAMLLAAHFGERMFSKNRGSLALGIVIAVATVAAMANWGAPETTLAFITVCMIATVFAFARWLPAYSVQGRKLQDHIEGLRQYLGVAEADDLRRMKAPPLTGEEFSRFLPYAVALGVEKNWATRFAKVAGAAAVAQAVSSYYSTGELGGGMFDSSGIGGFADSIGAMGNTVAAASTPPGSSSGGSSGGGGGGGSSGGGGGGGGGSGW